MEKVRDRMLRGKVQAAAPADKAREVYDSTRRAWKLSRGLCAVLDTADELVTGHVELGEELRVRLSGLVEMAAAVAPEIEEALAGATERAGDRLTFSETLS